MATTTAPNPGLVFDTLLAYQRTAALRAAIELDLFRAIGSTAGDVQSLARHCSASERGIRILCDYLTIMGFIEKSDGRYTHTPTSAIFLDPQSPASLAPTALFLGNPVLHQPFDQLAQVVRNGRTVLPGDGTVEPDNPAWVQFAHSMAPMAAPMAGPLAAVALEGMRGPVTVLDIAAGHGLFGIEIAKQNPEARIVAVDWPAVLDVARANARHAGVESRFAAKPGSAFDVDFGGPYDIVLLTNFLHHFDPATCTSLLKKIRAAMRTGGRIATLDFVPNDDRVSPPMAAGFSLTMLATTASGNVYTLKEYESMYAAAGFGDVKAHPVPTGPETVVVGRATA